MKVLLNRTLALGAVLALIGLAGTSATAQTWGNYRRSGYTSDQIRRERREIEVLQRIYEREMRRGNRAAAWRAHLRAERLRERIRVQRYGSRWDRY
jgi:hypothetical protein